MFSQLLTDRSLPKRLYWVDSYILNEILSKGYVYSTVLARKLCVSARCVQNHVAKLVKLGYIYHYGQNTCPFSAYRVHRDSLSLPIPNPQAHAHTHSSERELMASVLADYMVNLWRNQPFRTYFSIDWIRATVRSYDANGRCPGRPNGASVPFGVDRELFFCSVGPRVSYDCVVPMDCFDEILDLDCENLDFEGFGCFKWCTFSFEGVLFDLDGFDERFLKRVEERVFCV